MKKYTVSIATPCKASMQNMTPVIGGRFCNSCQKQVVDFSNLSDQQIIDYLKTHDHVCGSFLPSQLNRGLVEQPRRRWLPAALLAGMLALVLPETGKAQQQIKGIVVNTSGHIPIPGATVYLLDKHGNPMKTATMSKEDGSFTLEIPAGFDRGVKLQVSLLGFEKTTIHISGRKLKANKPVECKLKMDEIILGGLGFEMTTGWQRLKNRFFS